MHEQPRYDPLEPSALFADGRSARPLVAGTVPRGSLRTDGHLFDGRIDGQLAATFPMAITRDVLHRGRERFNIFCSPCHDRAGTSQGMVVQRGFPKPPALHIERLRQAPPGYFFEVMTHGFGRMPSYADQIPIRDRWAIAAWVRTLQVSQHVEVSELGAEERRELEMTNDQ
ncbi:MAG TPA: cytochrome c [Planctomycetaceae bacterium]|nr:cytochrome c [Planctomycetaceae bacterium]